MSDVTRWRIGRFTTARNQSVYTLVTYAVAVNVCLSLFLSQIYRYAASTSHVFFQTSEHFSIALFVLKILFTYSFIYMCIYIYTHIITRPYRTSSFHWKYLLLHLIHITLSCLDLTPITSPRAATHRASTTYSLVPIIPHLCGKIVWENVPGVKALLFTLYDVHVPTFSIICLATLSPSAIDRSRDAYTHRREIVARRDCSYTDVRDAGTSIYTRVHAHACTHARGAARMRARVARAYIHRCVSALLC